MGPELNSTLSELLRPIGCEIEPNYLTSSDFSKSTKILDGNITMTISRWRDLFASLEILYSPHGENTCSAEFLSKFESDSGVLFPTEYKEYCQVFGSGMFGSYMRIYYPHKLFDKILGITLSNMKKELENQKKIGLLDGQNAKAIEKKLNSAYPFADNSWHPSAGKSWNCIAFWDLETYSATDESYDIYLGYGLEFYFICRDFYEFITEFCLGKKSSSILPYNLQPGEEDITQTFLPF